MAKQEDQDPRIKAVSVLLAGGHIKKLEDIFHYMPATNLARAVGIRPQRLSDCRKLPRRFTLEDVYNIADLFSYDRTKMLAMIHKVANK